MYQAARLAKERVRALDFIDTEQLVDEFARSIRGELDYRAEARSAEAFRRNFAGDPSVCIPRVYWTYTRERVLVLELLEGTQLADIDVASMSPEERRSLVNRIAETWMTMIFRHGFFHADPHPANVFVLDGGDVVGLVDFGQVGKLTDSDMSRLTRLFIDAANERVEMLPRRLAELGVRYPRDREEEFTNELRDVYYRYYGVSLAEIDPLSIVREAFDLIYRLNLRLPTRFVLLDKAIATLGSAGIEVYPEFNVFEVAKPYARSLVIERFSPGRILSRAQEESAELAQIASAMPRQVYDFLEEIRDGQIEVGFVHKGLDEFMHKVDLAFNRLVIALVVVGGLIGSSLIGIFSKHGPFIAGVNFLSFIGFLLSFALGLWLLWSVIRSGRLR
jgi:ubiquinone biosynthesis protein